MNQPANMPPFAAKPTNWSRTELIEQSTGFDWEAHEQKPSLIWQNYLDFYELPSEGHSAGKEHIAGFEIMLQAWRPQSPQGTAILVHGLYDHIGLYRHLIKYCLEKNWLVIAFDLPGHGLSSGLPAGIDSFQEYSEVLHYIQQKAQNYKLPIYAFGQSTGGGILINYVLKNRLNEKTSPFKSLNLIAPLIRPKEWRRLFFLLPILKVFIKGIKRGYSNNSQDTDFLNLVWYQDPLRINFLPLSWMLASVRWAKFIEKTPSSNVKINIAQGDNDNTVAWQHNLKILAKKFPQQRLKIIHTGRHHMVNELPEIRKSMWDFFDQENL